MTTQAVESLDYQAGAAVDRAGADSSLWNPDLAPTTPAQRTWSVLSIAAQPDAWAKFVAGEGKAMGALVGHIMKASRGQADGKLVSDLLHRRRG